MSTLLAIIGGALILAFWALRIFVTKVKAKWLALATGIGIICIGMSGAFFYAEPGYSYMVQYPWGTQVAKMKPGYSLRWWGDKIPIKKVITIRKTHKQDKTSDTASKENNAARVRFMDTVEGKASLATRYRMPTDPQHFVQMAVDFRSEENLIHSALIPHTMEAVKNAARELTAQDYVSGAASTFEVNFLDQVTNGIVRLVRESDSDARKRMEIVQEDGRVVKQDQVIVERVKRVLDTNGQPIRKTNPLTQYNIAVIQASVEHVEPHPDFKQRLKAQMDQAALANLERLKAQKAEQEKRRIIADGEAKKAQEQVTMEMEQVKRLTAAETAKKQEEINRQQAEITLAKEKLRAQSIKVIAQAEADARRLKMQADGALEQKLEAWMTGQKYAWEALKGVRIVPDIQLGSTGGQESPGAALMEIIAANQAKQLNLNLRPPAGNQ